MIGEGNESDVDGSMVNMLVAKFSQEIERLKTDNTQLKLQRDNVTQFYKEEFSRLWQKYDTLPKQSIKPTKN